MREGASNIQVSERTSSKLNEEGCNDTVAPLVCGEALLS
jgi:hypothetical protein